MVIPLHDANPTRRRAVVTLAVIALNVLVFLAEPVRSSVIAGDGRSACSTEAFLDRWAAVPAELTTNRGAERVFLGPVQAGCLTGPPNYVKRPILSVLSAMFLHGGWLHLAGNMLFLWVFGNNVEDRFGRRRFLLFYLFCGFVATYGYAFTFPLSHTPLVGASGAIAGVLGAYLVLYPRARVTTLVTVIPVRMPAWLVLGFWFILQWVYSLGPVAGSGGVAYLAHIYGFVTGLVIAAVVRSRTGSSGRPEILPGHSYGSKQPVTFRRQTGRVWKSTRSGDDPQSGGGDSDSRDFPGTVWIQNTTLRLDFVSCLTFGHRILVGQRSGPVELSRQSATPMSSASSRLAVTFRDCSPPQRDRCGRKTT